MSPLDPTDFRPIPKHFALIIIAVINVCYAAAGALATLIATLLNGLITPASLNPGTVPTVIYRPAGVAGPGVVTSWADVLAAIGLSPFPVTVVFDFTGVTGPIVLPAGVWDVKGATFTAYPASASLTTPLANVVAWEVGCQVRNLAEATGTITLESQETTVGFAGLDWDTPAGASPVTVQLRLTQGALAHCAGTEPFIIVDPSRWVLQLVFEDGGAFVHTSIGNTTHFVHCLANAEVFVYCINAGKALSASYLIDSADGTAVLRLGGDSSLPSPSPTCYTDFTGSVVLAPSAIGLASTTAGRPSAPTVGQSVFDTTVGLPVWWNGAGWALAATPEIVFAPMGVAGNGVCTTWAEVMAIVAASPARLTIRVDFQGTSGTVTIPVVISDMRMATLVGNDPGAGAVNQTLVVPNGALLKNLYAIDNIKLSLVTNAVDVPSLEWDAPSSPVLDAIYFYVRNGARIGADGTHPPIIVDSTIALLQIQFETLAQSSHTGTTKLVRVKAGAVAGFVFEGTTVPDAEVPYLATADDATSSLSVSTYGNADLPTPSVAWPGFTLANVTYSNFSYGYQATTADRNAIVISKAAGTWYFDTTLGVPLWWDGTEWALAATSKIVFAPGGTAGNGVYTTWAGVMAAVAAARAPLTILVDPTSAASPVAISASAYDMKGATIDQIKGNNAYVLSFADGTTIKNLRSINNGIGLRSNNTVVNLLDWDVVDGTAHFTVGFQCRIQSNGAAPIATISGAKYTSQFRWDWQGAVGYDVLSGTAKMLAISGTPLVVMGFTNYFDTTFLGGPGTLVSGTTGIFVPETDGTCPFQLNAAAFSAFSGSYVSSEYAQGFACTTADRPAVTKIGLMVYDTTLNKPIWLKSTGPAVWVDATGTPV
jgi:hypothetical protein